MRSAIDYIQFMDSISRGLIQHSFLPPPNFFKMKLVTSMELMNQVSN